MTNKLLLFFLLFFLLMVWILCGCQKEVSWEGGTVNRCGYYKILSKDSSYYCNGGGFSVSFIEIERPGSFYGTMWIYPGKEEFDSLKVGDYIKL